MDASCTGVFALGAIERKSRALASDIGAPNCGEPAA
jgi:hypothetical protein